MSSTWFTVTRLPVVEALLAVIAGFCGMFSYMHRARAVGVDPEPDAMLFSFILYALSVVVALVWRLIADRTNGPRVAWIHFVLGAAILVWYYAGVDDRPTAIGDVLAVPLGLGILFAAVGSVIHRLLRPGRHTPAESSA